MALTTEATQASETAQTNETTQTGDTAQTDEADKINDALPSIIITNDLLQKNMEAVGSYRRKIRTIQSYLSEEKFEKYYEVAYIKNPLSKHAISEPPGDSVYDKEIIIENTLWNRMDKSGKWNKFLPENWASDPPTAFKYDLSMLYYPIDYGKLSFQPVGNEEVNVVVCSKYDVTGNYDDVFSRHQNEYMLAFLQPGPFGYRTIRPLET